MSDITSRSGDGNCDGEKRRKKVDMSLWFSGWIAVICFITYPITCVRGN